MGDRGPPICPPSPPVCLGQIGYSQCVGGVITYLTDSSQSGKVEDAVTGQRFIATEVDRSLHSAGRRVRVSTFPLALACARSVLLLRRVRALWHISNTAFANAYHHWRIRISINRVDFGPALRRLADGSLRPEERTLARSKCTDNLLATRPWADSVDVQMFLAGFDAGEQWCLHTSGIEQGKHSRS